MDTPEVIARIEEAMPLVDGIARRMRRQFGGRMPLEDLVSQGRETLLQAARSFDPERGVPFKRWVALRVSGSMMEAMRKEGDLPKRVYRKLRAAQAVEEIHENANEELAAAPPATPEAADKALGIQLSNAAMAAAVSFLAMRRSEALEHAQDPDHSPESNANLSQMVDKLKDALEARPEQERTLLKRIYFDDLTIDEAARELGLSKSWGSRLHARAIEGLSKAMRRAGVE